MAGRHFCFSMSSANNGPERWIRGGSKSLLKTRIFEVNAVSYRHAGRKAERDFVVIDSSDWVNVVALTKDLRMVLVKQFRFGTDAFSLEIPGGIIDKGEDPVEAGLRELREETGYAGESARLLASVHPNPAIMNNKVHFVLVENATLTHDLDWDPDEELEVELHPVDDVLTMARTGKITHSLIIAALMQFEGVWRSRPRPN